MNKDTQLKKSINMKKMNIRHIITEPIQTRPEVNEWMKATDLRIVQIIMKLNEVINKLNEEYKAK